MTRVLGAQLVAVSALPCASCIPMEHDSVPQHEFVRSRVRSVFSSKHSKAAYEVDLSCRSLARLPRVEYTSMRVDTPDIAKVAGEAIRSGCDILIVEATESTGAIRELAQRNQDVQFILVGDVNPEEPNLSVINPKDFGASKLVGHLLGRLTRTKYIGWIGPATDSPKSLDSFVDAAEAVDSAVRVQAVRIEEQAQTVPESSKTESVHKLDSRVDAVFNELEGLVQLRKDAERHNASESVENEEWTTIAHVQWDLESALAAVLIQWETKMHPSAALLAPYPETKYGNLMPSAGWNDRISAALDEEKVRRDAF